MRRRKRLLFVTDACPLPLDRGQRVRVHNLLLACSRAYDVTLVAPPPERDADRQELEARCARAVFVSPLALPWRERIALTARTARVVPGLTRPSTIRMYEPFVQALNQVQIESFDVVWAERVQIAQICAKARGRTIIDFDDIEHLKIARELRLKQSPGQFAHKLYSYAVYRHRELSWARQFLAVAVCSDEDRAYLEDHGFGNVVTVPNGANLAPIHGRVRHRSDPRLPLRIVFLGNVGYSANADAIAYFADEILPALRVQAPEATFDVIGPGATPALAARFANRVTFRGFVADLDGALSEYDVLAAPVRFGGGTKIKVLDAMAHRIPLVSTTVGVEGLSVRHGVHALVADNVGDFVEGLLRVKREPELAKSLVASAYSLVREHFSWDQINDRLADWLERLEHWQFGPALRAPASIRPPPALLQ